MTLVHPIRLAIACATTVLAILLVHECATPVHAQAVQVTR